MFFIKKSTRNIDGSIFYIPLVTGNMLLVIRNVGEGIENEK